MFADDLIIFSKASPHTLHLIQRALQNFHESAGLKANMDKSQIILGGCPPKLHEQCLQVMGLPESSFPVKYLGVPISTSRLTNTECSGLVEKIMKKMQYWATRNISFAGRAMLINSVVFGMFNYWASIFILPNEVLSRITKICRNFLWGGTPEYKKAPYISWHRTCLNKTQGGIGIKDFEAWNKAINAKLVWAIARKKDLLWVKWVHGRYLKKKEWWDYHPPADCSWYWKKLCFIKELFKEGVTNREAWDWQGQSQYRVQQGYKWLQGNPPKISWAKLVWSRANIPRHAFVLWIFLTERLPSKMRLNKFIQLDVSCPRCHNAQESDMHIIYDCPYAQEIWKEIQNWWSLPITSHQELVRHLTKYKDSRSKMQISCAIYAATVYNIWQARNLYIFQHQSIPVQATVKLIKEQVIQRILFLNRFRNKFDIYLDPLLT